LLAPAAEAASAPSPALAATLRRLMQAGLDDVYRGDLAQALAADLVAAGAPVTAADLAAHAAIVREPLTLRLRAGTAWAPPPPSQGVAALVMLGLLDRLEQGPQAGGFDHLHAVIEAAKQMTLLRDPAVADPDAMTLDVAHLLTPRLLAERASDIVPNLALQWPLPPPEDGTAAPLAPPPDECAVALMAVDAAGCLAVTLQSLGRRGGSGVASAATGVVMAARPGGFTLADGCPRRLAPGRRPFHALAPLLERLKDGRALVLAAGGGDAQPQTLAQLYGRLVTFGEAPAAVLAAPRLRLGPVQPGDADDVKAEAGLSPRVLDGLRAAGHAVRDLPARDGEVTGAAAVLVVAEDGATAAQTADPRATAGAALSAR
ncbi:gamma-glutamyltransferase, partial [Caenispirillum bisanense]|uniref:gamma-glutamyltransferase n=1 Tax=Caenispirillum bisanense TaxID=414052 RepID=UPI0031E106BF